MQTSFLYKATTKLKLLQNFNGFKIGALGNCQKVSLPVFCTKKVCILGLCSNTRVAWI